MRIRKGRIFITGWILLFYVILCLFPPFASANNQGLVWSIGTGARLDFILVHSEKTGNGVVTLLDEGMYVIIRELSSIPNDIDSIEDFYFPVIIDGYWQNGSEFNYPLDFVIFYLFPTGNWPLLTSIMQEHWQGARDIYQDSVMWGMRGLENSEDVSVWIDIQILKEDGATAYMLIEQYDKVSDITTTIKFIREGYTRREPVPLALTILVIAITGIAGVSLIVTIWRRGRAQKKFIEEKLHDMTIDYED